MKNKLIFKMELVVLAVCLMTPAAMAQRGTDELRADGWVLWDYPSIPTTEPPDTVTTIDYAWNNDGDGVLQDGDPSDTQQALYLGEQARAWYRFAASPTYGALSFLVYDKGTSFPNVSSVYGPRWGVQNNPEPNSVPAGGTPNDQLMCVDLIGKSYADANLFYYFINANNSDVANTSSHFSPTWPGSYEQPPGAVGGGERRVDGTLTGDLTVYDPADNVQGAWARWTFEVHDGEDMIFRVADPDGSNEQAWIVVPTVDSVFDTGFSTTGFNVVFFYGGNTAGTGELDHTGLWIDDVVFTPDDGQGVDAWSENFNASDNLCLQRGSYGDFNCDAYVGLIDLDILGQNWLVTGLDPATSYQFGDANADGEVALLDLDILGQSWNTPTPIPEPASLGLLVLGSLLAVRRR